MINMILQISADIGLAESLLFSTILLSTLFASVKLRSLVSMTLWAFLLISFIGVLEFNMQIMYFWIILILFGVGLVISMVSYTFGRSNI